LVDISSSDSLEAHGHDTSIGGGSCNTPSGAKNSDFHIDDRYVAWKCFESSIQLMESNAFDTTSAESTTDAISLHSFGGKILPTGGVNVYFDNQHGLDPGGLEEDRTMVERLSICVVTRQPATVQRITMSGGASGPSLFPSSSPLAENDDEGDVAQGKRARRRLNARQKNEWCCINLEEMIADSSGYTGDHLEVVQACWVCHNIVCVGLSDGRFGQVNVDTEDFFELRETTIANRLWEAVVGASEVHLMMDIQSISSSTLQMKNGSPQINDVDMDAWPTMSPAAAAAVADTVFTVNNSGRLVVWSLQKCTWVMSGLLRDAVVEYAPNMPPINFAKDQCVSMAVHLNSESYDSNGDLVCTIYIHVETYSHGATSVGGMSNNMNNLPLIYAFEANVGRGTLKCTDVLEVDLPIPAWCHLGERDSHQAENQNRTATRLFNLGSPNSGANVQRLPRILDMRVVASEQRNDSMHHSLWTAWLAPQEGYGVGCVLWSCEFSQERDMYSENALTKAQSSHTVHFLMEREIRDICDRWIPYKHNMDPVGTKDIVDNIVKSTCQLRNVKACDEKAEMLRRKLQDCASSMQQGTQFVSMSDPPPSMWRDKMISLCVEFWSNYDGKGLRLAVSPIVGCLSLVRACGVSTLRPLGVMESIFTLSPSSITYVEKEIDTANLGVFMSVLNGETVASSSTTASTSNDKLTDKVSHTRMLQLCSPPPPMLSHAYG
jgi:hypothetical protein